MNAIDDMPNLKGASSTAARGNGLTMVLIERDVVRGRYDAWKLTAYRFVSPKRPAHLRALLRRYAALFMASCWR